MTKRIAIRTMLAAVAVMMGMNAAHAGNIVVNGGFETGNLNGWTTNSTGTPSDVCGSGAGRNWNVSKTSGGSTTASGTGCDAVASPTGSSYAAYVMNDGPGPLDYILEQTITDPLGVNGGVLSFQWTSINSADSGRMFTVSIDGTDVFSQSTYGNFGWTTENINVTSILEAHAGQPITLEFDNYIPHSWYGPAGLGLDNVALNVTGSAVPEPGSVALFGVALAGLALARRKMNKQS